MMAKLLAHKKSYICKCDVLFILSCIVHVACMYDTSQANTVVYAMVSKVNSRYFHALYNKIYKFIQQVDQPLQTREELANSI